MKPKISIVTPSFNQGEYLEQTIDSVLSQRYENIEYIIIDGGSTDNSVEIIKKYERHLAYWVSEKDNGQSHAINKGLVKCTGDVFNWLNSDDYLEPGALENIAEAFSDPSTNVFCGRSRIFEGSTTLRYSNGTDIYPDNLEKTIALARIDQPETYFRKSCIDKVGFLNEKLHYVMDREWWIRYLLQYGLQGIIRCDEIIANFRLHVQSKTVSSSKHFLAEGFGLSYLFARYADNLDFKNALVSLGANIETKFEITKSNSQSVHWRKVCNYSALYFADYYYYIFDYMTSNLFLSSVTEEWLSKKEKFAMSKLKLRLKVPKVIRKFAKN